MSESIRDHINQDSSSLPVRVIKIPLYRPEGKSKIICVGNLHHREQSGKLTTEPINFARYLSSDENPVQRKFKVGEQWTPIETAWIKDIGYIIITNKGSEPFQVVPTPEQEKEFFSRVIEVGYMLSRIVENNIVNNQTISKRTRTHFDPPQPSISNLIIPLWEIPVYEVLQGKPKDEQMYLRCKNGEVTVSIMIIPN